MQTVAIIQARTGSTRLPGKVMYPLNGTPALARVVERVRHAETVDQSVVATSTEPPDDVIEQYAPEFGGTVVRGDESDVLSRFERATERYDPEIVIRVTGDCPLVLPHFIDESVQRIRNHELDYVCAGLVRTFPRGVTCETFTAESFERVIKASSEPHHREHVTPYYREHPNQFELYNLKSSEIFDKKWLQDRTDLRLTLDEPADYRLLETVYREFKYEGILDIRDAIRYIDENDLGTINQHVEQKSI